MARKKSKTSTSSTLKPNLLTPKEKIRLDNYRNKMGAVWLAITLVWLAAVALAVVKASEILARANKLDTAFQIGYAVIAIAFMTYRLRSRRLIVSSPTFALDMDSSIDKAKKFNNIELLKGTIAFGLIGIPALHFSGLLDPVFIYFGLSPSSVTNTAVQWLTSAIAFLASNAFAGIIGGIAYDRFKRKPESSS
jgi:small-conductance mechanosensitive channel